MTKVKKIKLYLNENKDTLKVTLNETYKNEKKIY